jgi:hypothetical protein
MTENDLARIEVRLGIKLPLDYRQFAASAREVAEVFADAQDVIAANESNRRVSWLGRALGPTFYIFGLDKRGRELFLDLDFPEPPVMLADHEHRRGSVQARNFGEWISKHESMG